MDTKLRNFLAEADELLQAIYENIKLLKKHVQSGGNTIHIINDLFRAYHTIKGISGMAGLTVLSEFTHNIENLLAFIRKGQVKPSQDVVDVLILTMGVFDHFFETIIAQGSDVQLKETGKEVIVKMNKLIDAREEGALEDSEIFKEIPHTLIKQLNDIELARLGENIQDKKYIYLTEVMFSFDTFDIELKTIHDTVNDQGELIATLPGSEADNDSTIGFNLLFASPSDEQVVSSLFDYISLECISKGNFSEISDDENDTLPEKVIQQSQTQPKKNVSSGGRPQSSSESLRVFVDDIDAMINDLEEFTIIKNNLDSEIHKIAELNIDDIYIQKLKFYADVLGAQISSFQKSIIQMRMIPLGTIFRRLESTTLKTAAELGKDVQLVLKGETTRIDKPLTDKLVDLMIHIIRNAVDHGIETEEERLNEGKSRAGLVTLNAFQRGNSVFVEISDDGKGVDLEKLLKKGIENGVVSQDAEPSRQEILDLIFLPGISTSDTVSNISGRGVGMDMVKEEVTSIGGTIRLDTQRGKGSVFTIQLPVTQAVISIFLVSSGDYLFGIPSFYVESIEKFSQDKSKYVQNRLYYRVESGTVPVINMPLILNTVDLMTEPDTIVMVNYLGHRYGILVENIIEEKEVTVKPFGGKFRNLKIMSGVCEFSSEKIGYIIDVGYIIDKIGYKFND